jgi:hypothetical protein
VEAFKGGRERREMPAIVGGAVELSRYVSTTLRNVEFGEWIDEGSQNVRPFFLALPV